MLNYIWLGLIVAAVLIGGTTGHLADATQGGFNNAKAAVMDVGLPLVGIMALWLGIMRLADKSGMVRILARLLRPVMIRLFPEVPPDHPAMGSMLLNMSANMLGLTNAATPFGLRAMNDLESLNPRPGTATNAMCTFLAINTSSIQLIPVTAVAILAVNKSTNPSAIIGTSLMASAIAAVSAIIVVKTLEKLPIFRLPPITESDRLSKATEAKTETAVAAQPAALPDLEWWGVLALAVFFGFYSCVLLGWFMGFMPGAPFHDTERLSVRILNSISALAIPMMLTFFPVYAAVRRISVYSEFAEGAKEGFNVVLRIIPNLVAMLVAIGMFRGAGGIDKLTDWLAPVMKTVNFPPELLPMAMIRPLSGSGTLGVFTDIVKQFGPDTFLSRTAGTMFGSGETTFYVLAVYFGSVNIRRSRHGVPSGLVADVVSLIASLIICHIVFGQT